MGCVGSIVGFFERALVGSYDEMKSLGSKLGTIVGPKVGRVGIVVGLNVGSHVGKNVGSLEDIPSMGSVVGLERTRSHQIEGGSVSIRKTGRGS